MSSNTFIALPVPNGVGVGAPANVSALAPGPAFVVDGDNSGDSLVLEISNDGGTTYGPVTLSGSQNPPLKTLYGKNNRDIAEPYIGKATGTGGMVAQFARIRRISGSGVVTAGLGSITAPDNLFVTLNDNTPVDTSLLGPLKTIVCTGTYSKPIVVEGSTDGVNYDAVCQFNTQRSDVKYVVGSYLFMRLRAAPTTDFPAGGSVSVGAGTQATAGATGAAGPAGPAGPAGVTEYAMFFGLTEGTNSEGTDYAATIAPKTADGTGRVPFPQDGPTNGLIGRLGINGDWFNLPSVGIYEIIWKVHTTEPGQLQLEVQGPIGPPVDQPQTVTQDMNPTLGGHLMVGYALITTVVTNSPVAVINPSGNSPALTVTPADGASTHANAQSITIKRVA